MLKKTRLASAFSKATGWGSAFALAAGLGSTASFQVHAEDVMDDIEEVVVTGSRIKRPGMVSTSPIFSLGSEEIAYSQEVELETILRQLPSTIPGDGANTNNGTDGAATVNLRGLEAKRNLILINGRRMTPFNQDGEVDTSVIPTALIERVDIITGGASAVYGSDAIAGAINIILKNDFQGFEISTTHSETSDGDGEIDNVSLTWGSDLLDGRGNIAMNFNWAERKPLLLGERALGQLGIRTSDGAGLADFNSGSGPTPSTVAGCGGPDVVDFNLGSGSTTSIPTRANIAGAGNVGQFLDDRTLYTADREGCSRFNFNPYNFYRTPQEKYNAFVVADFDLHENFKPYASLEFSNITVEAQVAPSGTFGARFDVPLANPFLSAQAQGEIISFANAAVAAGNLTAGGSGDNWNDVNGNGVVDAADYLKMQLRRRTLELGPRTEKWDNDHFMLLAGARGTLYGDWNYDASFQYGESNRITVRDGYTNLTNIQTALDTTSTTTCTNSSDANCVPLDIFGGFGTITEAMAGYARAIALQQQKYEQTIMNINVDGPVDFVQLPTANSPMSLSLGFEKRDEFGSLDPDECLKLAPASCQGGAGGNLLPIAGGYSVDEFFLEGYLPLVEGMTGAQNLSLEFGFRASDYSTVGSNDTYKVGFNWTPVDSLLVRIMQQEATRAPNVEELFSPITTGLSNATQDPCSVANVGNITPELTALCVSTGMLATQVGVIQDIVSGQVNDLRGSDLTNPPLAETAETFTVGFVWTPAVDAVPGLTISVDYYDIDIEDFIGAFSAQETFDACYTLGQAAACNAIVRVDGDLTSPSSGIERFFTNLEYFQAEGIEVGVSGGFDLGDMGDLQLSANINKYLTNESQSSTTVPVIDCLGHYSTSCDPVPEISWNSRATWNWNALTVSLQWRHIDDMTVEPAEAAAVFVDFQTVDSYDYFDLYASYSLLDDKLTLSVGIDNLSDEDPPIVGNAAGDTSSNSGNTFPSQYDILGTVYTFGAKYHF